jgi:ASC-1-like (ASCH) protein
MTKWVLKFASWKKKNDIFEMVKSGKKTIEDRPYNPEKKRNYSKVKPGDILVLKSLDTGEKIEKTTRFTHIYKSVAEMAENEPVGKIIPGCRSAEELVAIFEQLKKKWGRNYARKLGKYGIVAIGME